MKYEFNYYTDADFDGIEQLVLNSYKWDYPIWGLSRQEFSRGLHPEFNGNYHAWEHTVGVYKLDGKIAACVINEGNYSGEEFFLFDSKERAEDKELLKDMIKFSKTHGFGIKDDRRTHEVNLFVPDWNVTLKEMMKDAGFTKSDYEESIYILPFKDREYEVKLPEGYSFADGNTTPDFYLSNTHRFAFGYGRTDNACEHGEKAFHNLRQMKHHRNNLDLCILDEMKRPVAMAIIWYDECMPYCELEPLGVAWWERRKGLATAILHEAANRVKKQFPLCKGMTGGDQEFYSSIGYEKKSSCPIYNWQLKVYISWEKESKDKFYSKEI